MGRDMDWWNFADLGATNALVSLRANESSSATRRGSNRYGDADRQAWSDENVLHAGSRADTYSCLA
jgi:hypothetical protein